MHLLPSLSQRLIGLMGVIISSGAAVAGLPPAALAQDTPPPTPLPEAPATEPGAPALDSVAPVELDPSTPPAATEAASDLEGPGESPSGETTDTDATGTAATEELTPDGPNPDVDGAPATGGTEETNAPAATVADENTPPAEPATSSTIPRTENSPQENPRALW